MYFKQLEIVGFKSFPTKTKLKFEPGITAVVGPNGCGKSNVSDAIRWVLGEQSARNMRGSSMEDVIFNGTESVEPINMAEVSLTLSNEDRSLPIDYDEVTITRRLFRSGESEYILNKTPVRLKDISHLLMGTGMGTSSYSIIEQGKIDLILSSRPEDRRYIFEEASGITRYKTKKKEALRRLEHTEDNLVRIGDIINEVKRQINSIERHAKKAERYRTDFEVMKELDLKLTSYELIGINQKLSSSKAVLDDSSQKEEMLKMELEESIKAINARREELDRAISHMTEMQRNLSETTLYIEKALNKVSLNDERVEDLKNRKSELGEELIRLGERIETQEKEVLWMTRRLDEITETKWGKEKTVDVKSGEMERLGNEIDTHQRDIKSTNGRTLDALAFQTRTKNELIKLGADLVNRKARQHRLESEKKNTSEEKDRAGALLNEAEHLVAAYGENVRKNTHVITELRSRLSVSTETFEKTKKRMSDIRHTMNSLRSKEEMLNDLIARFEGFENGVKLVVEAQANGLLSGIMGVVADIMQPAEGYEAALEAALGKKAEAIVVEDRKSLFRALNFLEDKKAKASFIVYEDIAANTRESGPRTMMQNFGAEELRSFIEAEASFHPVCDFLLGGIYVIEDIDKASQIYNVYAESVRFVTREGTYVEKGFVTGGFKDGGQVTSIVGRKKRLEEIRNEEALLKGELETLNYKEIHETKGIEGLKRELAAEENELKKQEIAFANALSRKETIEINFKKVSDEAAIVLLEISEVNELIHDISFKGDELNTKLNVRETEYAKDQLFIASSQEALQNKTKAKNDLAVKLSELRSELIFMNSTEEDLSKNLTKETALFGELKTQSESKKSDAKDSEEKTLMLDAETKELNKIIESKKSEELLITGRLSEVTGRREALSKDLKAKEVESRETESSLEIVRNEIRAAEIEHRENELLSVNIFDRIRQSYKVDISTFALDQVESCNWEETKNQVEVLRIKLEKLGPVNLVAIDELKELEERYSFLTKQQNDLFGAKESLHKAIVKINQTTKKLFIETFREIQVEFKNYFRMLFGGGHAELLLLDEGDVLESGIEIVIRPPGKKLQNLLLLSGGEKALTAMALLFAIFKVKPSPFCILDEVDAPLDESNIGRFTRILHEFLKTSQFIIITHSKRTMQMANVLYGITMQQKGISKIVSVRFGDDLPKQIPRENKEVMV